jgi:hypothetical protein
MTPLGVKTCGESEFKIFEAKNTSLIQRRRMCIKAKSRKMRFSLKNDPFWDKICGIQLVLNPKNFINVKFGFPAHFYSQKGSSTTMAKFSELNGSYGLNRFNF